MPDALSRLPSIAGAVKRATDSDLDKDEEILDIASHVTLIEMSDDFKMRLKEGLMQAGAAAPRHHGRRTVRRGNRDNYLEE